MEVSFTFRHMEPSTELRSYVEEKVYKVKKYFDSPVEAHIVLKVEKFRHIADMTISIDGNKIKAVDESGDMYLSIDQVMDKIEEQLRRLMSRKKEYRLENIKSSDFSVGDIETQERQAESEPEIIKTERVDIKPMDIDEAAMQMDMSKRNFLVFTNSKSNSINIIYKRKDGNLGLIETSTK
ncbi:MAG: ribosome-associated translation inhibitor RaiA [Desulfobacteraceae bacterium]|nr:MAG: ribosome-associated translation inhibitor RaiA [Desulfobacteraceae bacterium]